MKLHFKPTDREEGFRAGQALDESSIMMAIRLKLSTIGIFDEPEYEAQEDGTLIAEINGVTDEKKEEVVESLRRALVEGWGDMTIEVLEE